MTHFTVNLTVTVYLTVKLHKSFNCNLTSIYNSVSTKDESYSNTFCKIKPFVVLPNVHQVRSRCLR